MVSIIWGFFIVIGVFFSVVTGQIEPLNNQILKGASEGISILMEMLPVLVLWTGVMKIAEDAGILQKFSNLVRPVLNLLFPSLAKDDPALGYIASNIAANALGLGSAATPFGLKAMEELQKKNPKKDTATEAMITFLILNTGGVTIVPTTVIALRLMHGSANPSEIIITSILATACSSISGLFLDYVIRKRKRS
jgi:spore maturation protein A